MQSLENITDYIELANRSYNNKEFQKSSEIFETIFNLQLKENQLFTCYNRLGHSYLQTNQLDKAEQIFSNMTQILPHLYHGFEGLAIVSQKNNDWDKAIKFWKIVSENYKNVPHAYDQLYQCYIKTNQLTEASISNTLTWV